MPTNAVATLVNSIERRASMRVETSGWLTRRSHCHHPTSTTRPPTTQATVRGDPHPHECPCVMDSSTADRPTPRPSAPIQSIVPAVARSLLGTTVSTMARTSTVNPVVSQNTR